MYILRSQQKLLDEVSNLENKFKDVTVLSKNVIKLLDDSSETAKASVEETVTMVTNKYKT